MRAHGFDISIWQDSNSTPQMVDFLKAKAAGIRFAFIKAAQANFLDSDFVMNWQHAKDAGIRRGAYHFLDWRYPLIEQARFFAGVLRKDPGELPPVLDFESRVNVPDRATASQAAKSFVLIVEQELERRPILYTSPGYWREFGSTDPFWRDYPLWVAHYTTASAPIVPAPWQSWQFWQYTSHGDGPRYGTESLNVDLNWFNGSEDDFAKQYGALPDQPPTPLPSSGIVQVDNLFLRSWAGKGQNIIGQLDMGAVVDILERKPDPAGNGEWLRVKANGWVAGTWAGSEFVR
jgi:lysozyme